MLEIRPMSDGEALATAEMHVRTWRSAYTGIVPGAFLAAMDPAQFAERRRARRTTVLVAVRDGVIIGNADYGHYREDDGSPDPRHGELNAIYVDPSAWGTGTGHALFAAVEQEMTGTWPDMRLWVLEDNLRARRFYERQGMRPDGASDFWTPHGTAARLRELRYVKAL
ncbi:GNAT family N-acetyltransferase [Actinoplanes sp. RD1]|uniref:GNAT family N-acetyltransferase n=1 Tax=Actinoplanes sp. RD1 TaxID=3064538 RepID=UPI002740C403|nr:GNAT family N-acetyltransferase [Actinoplanes sp. RD1]